jgi:hypothetical protein
MDIAGEMEIDILHREDLNMTSSCGSTFDAEYRSH